MPPILERYTLRATTESQMELHQRERIQELHNLSLDLLRNFGKVEEKRHGIGLNQNRSVWASLPARRGSKETSVKIWTIFSDSLENPWINIHIPLIRHKGEEVNISLTPLGQASFIHREGGNIRLIKDLLGPDKPSLGELMQYLNWVRPLHKELIEDAKS